MKVLYIVNALAIHGGLERVIVDKMNWLAEHTEFGVYVVTMDQGNHPVVYPLHKKIYHVDLGIFFYELYQYNGLKRLKSSFLLHKLLRSRLKEIILDISPDIVICTQKQYVGDVDRARGKIPLVFECHSAYLAWRYEDYGVWQRLENMLYNREVKKVQMVVSLTKGDADEWRKITPHVMVIPNIVHLNDMKRISDCRSKKVIFVGRYTSQKDIGSLLHIWNLVHLRHPDWQLNLYGGLGNELGKWQKEMDRMNSNVEVHDPTSDIIDKYLESSLLLLTSIYEPFGLVLPEAMSCGLPVVAFNCPYGPGDIVTDGVDGYLIKNRDVDAFADRICHLIENEELRLKMGKVAIRSTQRYKSDKIMPQWIKLFNEIISVSN